MDSSERNCHGIKEDYYDVITICFSVGTSDDATLGLCDSTTLGVTDSSKHVEEIDSKEVASPGESKWSLVRIPEGTIVADSFKLGEDLGSNKYT